MPFKIVFQNFGKSTKAIHLRHPIKKACWDSNGQNLNKQS